MSSRLQGATDALPALGIEEVDDRLVEAIQDGRLRQLLRELEGVPLQPPARARVAEGIHAVAAIDAAVEAETERLTRRLIAAAVRIRSPRRGQPDRPLHLVPLEVESRHADTAAAVLEAEGYRRLGPASEAAWRAFRATGGGCGFMRSEPQPFRVELSWPRALALRGPAARLVAPHRTDFDAVSLPSWLWPGYTLVHLLRLPLRRLRRHREPADLGPFLETPDALVEPLLRFAGLTERDLLVDLGCGDGRIVVKAAQLFGCRALGVETDRDLVARARAAVAAAGVGDRVRIDRADAARATLDDAGVVVAFLPVATVEALLPSILRRLPAGARFVAHEQERLRADHAHVRAPLLSAGGISVAHRWNR